MTATHGRTLPEHWPSTWPWLWRPVRDRAVLALPAALLTLAGLSWLGDLTLSWWVPLLPLLLMIGPVTRPARARRSFDRATRTGRLTVLEDGDTLHVWGTRRSVVATVTADGSVQYRDGVRGGGRR